MIAKLLISPTDFSIESGGYGSEVSLHNFPVIRKRITVQCRKSLLNATHRRLAVKSLFITL
ncbi:MAG: hypothetical protein LBH04_11215 [Tannerellaceae bacterium]|nr:hypothetical protein [Tannerellaceae bacterium]